jgi:metallo-beta-lactamase class B
MKAVIPLMLLSLPLLAAEKNSAEQHEAAARAAAGQEHTAILNTICTATGRGAVEPNALPSIPGRQPWYALPVKVFDNLYFVGQTGYSAWAITTSDGIILVDAIYDYSVEAEVVDGLKSLGLDPKQIRYVVVSHGHLDHAGGAALLQDRFKAKVIAHKEDWDLMARNTQPWPKPRRDIEVGDDYRLKLGDTTVHLIHTPGHTPGTLSTLFEVRDGKRTHTVAEWGGTAFNFTITPDRPREYWLKTYAASAAKFRSAAKAAHADIILSNHTVFDDSLTKLPALATRKPGAQHPFVVGAASVERYLTVAEQCALAGLARQEQGESQQHQ